MTKLSDFFETLDDEERDNLMERMTARWYQPSELIYGEGETPRQLFCLLSGKVKIFKEGVGRSQTVRILQAVEYFGYRAAMSQQQFITAASARNTHRKMPVWHGSSYSVWPLPWAGATSAQ